MAKVIAIINQKGGVGKTTTAVNLSALLGAMGQRVLMIDLDPQGNTTSGLGMEVDDKSIYEVIMGRMKLADVMEETEFKNLSIAGSDVRLANAELELVEVEKREYRLKTAVQSVQQDFDFIFIDCPPSLGLLTINALGAADSVLIPIPVRILRLGGRCEPDEHHLPRQKDHQSASGNRGRPADDAGWTDESGLAGGGRGEEALQEAGVRNGDSAQRPPRRSALPRRTHPRLRQAERGMRRLRQSGEGSSQAQQHQGERI